MDQIETWLTGTKIPVGRSARSLFDWLTDHGQAFFDAASDAISAVIGGILAALSTPHPLIVTAAFMALTWILQRRLVPVAIVGAGFAFILNQGYWTETMQTLTLVLVACILCMGVGVPIGIAAAHRPRLYAWLRPVLDLMQTLPAFVYLIPAIGFFGIGTVTGLFATVVFVLAAPIRLTYLGIAGTPRHLIEAATAFGATPRQVLWKVELPSAMPQIMAGLNQAIMLSLSMVVITALVGSAGLGVPVMRAVNTVNSALGFESGLVIVVVAVMLDQMLRREVPR
ncbi:MAG: choline ABC transporter permease subunit [Paracoccus sp. (in: a-proteobacteria)]|nr:choline ABC transporter permease subunit [Paracoccus sp. (in: a-proteobacteria)]